MRAFLFHSVAANGGDELLCMTLKLGMEKFCGVKIVAASTNNILSFPYLPVPYKFLNDTIGGRAVTCNSLSRKLLCIARYRCPLVYKKLLLVLDRDYRFFCELMKDIDLIVFGPGGFLHEYYEMQHMCELIEILKAFGKKIIIFGQSVGPFSTAESKDSAYKIFQAVDRIVLRERYSARYVLEVDSTFGEKIFVYTDIAFFYNKLTGERNVAEPENSKRVLLNFRTLVNPAFTEDIVRKAVLILKYLVSHGYKPEFISTCQGVEGYRDDSFLAHKILESAQSSDELIDAVVHTKRYSLSEYLHIVKNSRYYIGMRMHAAILPILRNIPVLNIGYEPKSKGVFESIGLGDYVCNILDSDDVIVTKVEELLSQDYHLLKKKFADGLQKGEELTQDAFVSLTSSFKDDSYRKEA